jgi:hypothetical protein
MLGALLGALAGDAWADGAFPDSQSIMVPADQAHVITLATNFGLVSSTDDGATWSWACELTASNNAYLYQMGAPPTHRLFALSTLLGTNNGRLIFSDDNACGWNVAGGLLSSTLVLDAFPDPTDPTRVVAIANAGMTDGPSAHVVLESKDGGATFTQMLYAAAAGDLLTGVEIARSDSQTIYVTVSSGAMFLPRLLRSTDGGAHWTSFDLQASLGVSSIRLIAIDPEDAQRVFLRVSDAEQDQLALVEQGGTSVKTVLTAAGGRLAAFTRLPSKTVLVAGSVGADAQPALFRSTDGGGTFAPVSNPPHLRALAGRGTQVFGAADFQMDNYALGVSSDDGLTWNQMMRFDQVRGIKGCVKDVCQTSCRLQVDSFLWSLDVCSATVGPTATPDAGTPADAGTTTPPPPPSSGGGCQLTRGGWGGAGGALAAVALLLAVRRRQS